ncbi:hypothetical protein G9A89_011970 [Geosiphon pyriformis]|nr:hypothetical protein G9A89_011970 [Geosiphon pyriformis]
MHHAGSSLVVHFKGPMLTKKEWVTRKTKLATFELEGFPHNDLIQVEKDWSSDVLAIKEELNDWIFHSIQHAETNYWTKTVKNILFTGHAIGGAYATIAALHWRIGSSYFDINNSLKIDFAALKLQVITFGAPRVGNAVFARLVNKLLDVFRITYFNDHVPHFPKYEVDKKNLLQHSETEYWILPSCECPNNGEDLFYECRGFDYGLKGWKQQYIGLPMTLVPERGMSGENEECNAAQRIKNIPDNCIHLGPYFGIIMNN